KTVSVEHLVLDRSHGDPCDVERSGQRHTNKKHDGDDASSHALLPQSRQQQRDEWRGCEPPVIKHLDVVPDPRRHLQEIWNDEAEREWQKEDQHSSWDEVTSVFEKNRREEQWDEHARVLEPEIHGILLTVIPADFQRKETAGIHSAVHGGPE